MAISFDISILGKREQFRSLAWLGRHDWMKPSPTGTRGIKPNLKFPAYDASISKDEYARMQQTIQFLSSSNLHTEALWMWTLSKLFASGPKLFCPTYEQCLAMSEVEIGITAQRNSRCSC
jgi:hypothetical protein